MSKSITNLRPGNSSSPDPSQEPELLFSGTHAPTMHGATEPPSGASRASAHAKHANVSAGEEESNGSEPFELPSTKSTAAKSHYVEEQVGKGVSPRMAELLYSLRTAWLTALPPKVQSKIYAHRNMGERSAHLEDLRNPYERLPEQAKDAREQSIREDQKRQRENVIKLRQMLEADLESVEGDNAAEEVRMADTRPIISDKHQRTISQLSDLADEIGNNPNVRLDEADAEAIRNAVAGTRFDPSRPGTACSSGEGTAVLAGLIRRNLRLLRHLEKQAGADA